MSWRRMAGVSLTCLGLLAGAGSAQASCNVIPDSALVLGATPAGAKITETIPADLGYRGAFGRIDGAALAGASPIVLGPDDYCRSQEGKKPLTGLRAGDVQAMILYEPDLPSEPAEGPSPPPHALFYSSAEGCRALREKFRGDGPVHLLDCLDAAAELRISPSEGSDRLTLRGSPEALPGAVTIVVIDAEQDATAGFPVERLLDGDCAGLGNDFGRDPRSFCIDTIYDDYLDRCAVAQQYAAVVPASVVNVPKKNDFQKNCFGPDPGNGLEACEEEPTRLDFTEDKEGNVYIPFDFADLIDDGSGGTITRIVSGLTATGRQKKREDPRIRIPGREFVGSTPYGDPNGTSTNWRKPEIEVYQPADRPEEFGLKGHIDKPDAILRLHPRLAVGWRCDSDTHTGEACMGVEQTSSGGVESCAAGDRPNATCTPLSKPEYAACSGGPLDGMPCTRPAHCGTGACNGVPKCQPLNDSVWKPGLNSGTTPCKTGDECGNNERCGYTLFDLGDRKNVVYDVESGFWKKKRRGVCEDDKKEICRGGDGGTACSSGAACVGYHLEDHGKKP